MALTADLKEAIAKVSFMLAEVPLRWLLGGSCGLLLQGVDVSRAPRDLDLYVDLEAAQTVHQALLPFAVDEPQDSVTEIYTSRLSHYEVPGTGAIVELVGGFRVHRGASFYRVEVNDFLFDRSRAVHVDGCTLRLMPLAHELVFNLLRRRPDRYGAIAEAMAANEPERHALELRELAERNRLEEGDLDKLGELLYGKRSL